jgi:hypothetical protein
MVALFPTGDKLRGPFRTKGRCDPALATSDHERQRLVWSGDRLEWLPSQGFHAWFAEEVRAGRVAYPS